LGIKAFTRRRGVAERVSYPRQVDVEEEIEVGLAILRFAFDPLRALAVVVAGIDDRADQVCVEDEEWGVGSREWGVGAFGLISHCPHPTPYSRIFECHLPSRNRLDIIRGQLASNALRIRARELRHPWNVEVRGEFLGQRRLAGALRTYEADACAERCQSMSPLRQRKTKKA
jgi:hypothetical protein